MKVKPINDIGESLYFCNSSNIQTDVLYPIQKLIFSNLFICSLICTNFEMNLRYHDVLSITQRIAFKSVSVNISLMASILSGSVCILFALTG